LRPPDEGRGYLPREVFFLGLALDGVFFDVSDDDLGTFFAGITDPLLVPDDQIHGVVPPGQRGLL
jgi:hypothetical protein